MVLHELARAVADGDGEAAAALAPAGESAAADLLRAVVGNAQDLGLSLGLRYVDETGGVAADGAWTADVAATWTYAGDTGTEPARAEVSVRLRP